VILLHGENDTLVKYANGKKVYNRAQSVGLPSTFITIEGKAHGIMDEVRKNYMDELSSSLFELVTKGAQAPEGCF